MGKNLSKYGLFSHLTLLIFIHSIFRFFFGNAETDTYFEWKIIDSYSGTSAQSTYSTFNLGVLFSLECGAALIVQRLAYQAYPLLSPPLGFRSAVPNSPPYQLAPVFVRGLHELRGSIRLRFRATTCLGLGGCEMPFPRPRPNKLSKNNNNQAPGPQGQDPELQYRVR